MGALVIQFICQVALARKQRRDLLVLELSCTTHGGGFTLCVYTAERQAGKLHYSV